MPKDKYSINYIMSFSCCISITLTIIWMHFLPPHFGSLFKITIYHLKTFFVALRFFWFVLALSVLVASRNLFATNQNFCCCSLAPCRLCVRVCVSRTATFISLHPALFSRFFFSKIINDDWICDCISGRFLWFSFVCWLFYFAGGSANTDIGPDSEAQIAPQHDDYDEKEYDHETVDDRHPVQTEHAEKNEKIQSGQRNGNDAKTNTPVWMMINTHRTLKH